MGMHLSSPAPPQTELARTDPITVKAHADPDAGAIGVETPTSRDSADGDYERVGTPEGASVACVPATSAPAPAPAPATAPASASPKSAELSLASSVTITLAVPAIVSTESEVGPEPPSSASPGLVTDNKATAVIQATSETPVAAATTGTGRAAVDETILVAAVYGTASRHRNVAAQLQKLSFPWQWSHAMNPNAYFGGDPHPDQSKTLTLVFAYRDGRRPNLELRFQEFGARWRHIPSVSSSLITFV